MTVVTSVGAGRMGRGIAQTLAYAGATVRLLDGKARDGAAYERLAAEALGEIRASLVTIADLGGFDPGAVEAVMSRISVHSADAAAEALADADYVFEGVPEVLEAKREAFALFDAHAPDGAILASTTSTILSTTLADFTRRPSHFLNAHFLNPAFLVPLVELSPTDRTAPDVVQRLSAYLEGAGKVPVVCRAAPGYIVPRIQALAMNEAARIVEEGVASAEDVDKAVKYGFGLRFAVLGLLEFIDWGGGDILAYASDHLAGAFDDDRFAAPDIVRRNMAEGKIGLKTGEGFYDWRTTDVAAYRRARLGDFLRAVKDAGLLRPPVISDTLAPETTTP